MTNKKTPPSAALDEMRGAFNRALLLAFSKQKLMYSFCVIALCGLLAVFFRGLAVHAGQWVTLSLTFLPIFLCAGILLSLGLILTRVYHDEIKGTMISYKETVNKSLELMVGATYISVPFILVYLLLWMLLGVFYLLKEIPALGDFIGVILAFGPFLLNLASILLTVGMIGVLFFVTPALALRSADRLQLAQLVMRRVQADVFTNIVYFVVALLPLVVTTLLLTLAALLTGSAYVDVDKTSEIVLQWFFIMLPYTALLTPAIVFFFNFAAESHVLLQKQLRASRGGAG